MNIVNCISDACYNIWHKTSYASRMIRGIVFILVILESVFLITQSIQNYYEDTIYANIPYNAVRYYTSITEDGKIKKEDMDIISDIESIENTDIPSCSFSADVMKKTGDTNHYYIRIDRTSLKCGNDIYYGIEDKSFDFFNDDNKIVKFKMSICLDGYAAINSNLKKQFKYYYPDEKLFVSGKEASLSGEIMMSTYMIEHYGIKNYNELIGKNISVDIDGNTYIKDAKLVGIINEKYFRMNSTLMSDQIIFCSSENQIENYAGGLEEIEVILPINDISKNNDVYNQIKDMKLDSSLSMSRTFLLALSYTEQLNIVSRYILKYLFFFIILAMSLSLYSVISNYISSMVPYYGMMGAIGMKKTSMLLSFVFEQFIMIIVSVFVSFPIYEIFVVLINKVISVRVGGGLELKLTQVVIIAVQSSVICSFIILGMSLFVFLMSFSKNIISMMKKV